MNFQTKSFLLPKFMHPSPRGFRLVMILFLIGNLFLISCVQESEVPTAIRSESAQLAKIKAWFEENKSKLRLSGGGTNLRMASQELILPFFEKEPDWDQFHHYYFPDGREVFEISLANATKYFPTTMLDSFPNRNPAEVVIQNILFIKHPTEERFDPVIARYYPDNKYASKEFKEISYDGIPHDWSGKVDIWTYDERHFIGFTFEQGELVSYSRYLPAGSSEKSRIAGDCRTLVREISTNYVGKDGIVVVMPPIVVLEVICSGAGEFTSQEDDTFSYGGNPNNISGFGGGIWSYNPPDLPSPEATDPEEKRKSQLDYLRNHGESEFVEVIEKLLLINNISHYEVIELNNLVNKVYFEVKGKFMMGIFSPANISQILLLAFSSNVSNEFRNTIFNSIPRYSAYNDIYLLIGNKSWNVNGVITPFTGYTSHGALSYGISKGFSPSLIRSILNNGTVIRVPYQNSYQLRIFYQYEGRTVGIVIDSTVGGQNFGKIVTYLTNY